MLIDPEGLVDVTVHKKLPSLKEFTFDKQILIGMQEIGGRSEESAAACREFFKNQNQNNNKNSNLLAIALYNMKSERVQDWFKVQFIYFVLTNVEFERSSFNAILLLESPSTHTWNQHSLCHNKKCRSSV